MRYVLSDGACQLEPAESVRYLLRNLAVALEADAIVLTRLNHASGRIENVVESWPANFTSNVGPTIKRSLIQNKTEIGRLEIWAASDLGSREHEFTVDRATSSAILLLERLETSVLLKGLVNQIDYTLRSDHFLKALVKMVSDSSGMPFIVVREYNRAEDTLYFRCSYGFEEVHNPAAHLTIKRVTHISSLSKLIKGGSKKIVQVSSHEMDEKDLTLIRQQLAVANHVESFIVLPLYQADQIYGTLSIGTATQHFHFPPGMVDNFGLIANAAGVALSNSYKYAAYKASVEAQGSLALDRATNYFISAAKTSLNRAVTQLLASAQSLTAQDKSSSERTKIAALIERLRRIEELTRRDPFERVPRKVWEKVKLGKWLHDLMSSTKLALPQINIPIREYPVAETYVVKEKLDRVFKNLILNTIQISDYRRIKRGEIDVTMTVSDGAIIIVYTDTMGGIIEGELHSRLESASGRKFRANDIFEDGVTGRAKGTGQGMGIIKRAVQELGGDIQRLDFKDGIRFQIRLPMRKRAPLE